MTGGVSLAIWMGGCARELLATRRGRRREAGADDPDEEKGPDGHLVTLYRGLLDLLDQVVRIDVLSAPARAGSTPQCSACVSREQVGSRVAARRVADNGRHR